MIPIPYRLGGWMLRAAMGFYFSRIERFHQDRVPRTGPVLFTSNHPNSVTDALVIVPVGLPDLRKSERLVALRVQQGGVGFWGWLVFVAL